MIENNGVCMVYVKGSVGFTLITAGSFMFLLSTVTKKQSKCGGMNVER